MEPRVHLSQGYYHHPTPVTAPKSRSSPNLTILKSLNLLSTCNQHASEGIVAWGAGFRVFWRRSTEGGARRDGSHGLPTALSDAEGHPALGPASTCAPGTPRPAKATHWSVLEDICGGRGAGRSPNPSQPITRVTLAAWAGLSLRRRAPAAAAAAAAALLPVCRVRRQQDADEEWDGAPGEAPGPPRPPSDGTETACRALQQPEHWHPRRAPAKSSESREVREVAKSAKPPEPEGGRGTSGEGGHRTA